MLLIFSPCNNAHGNGALRQNLTRNGGKVHRTLWELWIDVQASSTGHFFLGWGIWLPSNKNIAPVLFNYDWLSAEWCNSLSKSSFFFVCTLSVCFIWSALDYTRWINAIFLSFQVPLFSLWIHSSFQYLFSPLCSPVSFFHEQEGFTLLLCHPNWLH